MPQQYNFYSIFTYVPTAGTITPKFDIIINNFLLRKGKPVTPTTYIGGINLFEYVGRSFAGEWDSVKKQLTIERFY